jgi:hypothetical protein
MMPPVLSLSSFVSRESKIRVSNFSRASRSYYFVTFLLFLSDTVMDRILADNDEGCHKFLLVQQSAIELESS